MNPKIWHAIILGGIVIGIIGCFLPWGKLNPSLYYPWQDVRVGTLILSGIYTFASLMFAAIFQMVFIAKKKLYMVFPVLATALVALFILETWIGEPVACEYSSGGSYTVLYGAYVTLVGIVVVSATAFLYLAIAAEKQLNLGKSE